MNGLKRLSLGVTFILLAYFLPNGNVSLRAQTPGNEFPSIPQGDPGLNVDEFLEEEGVNLESEMRGDFQKFKENSSSIPSVPRIPEGLHENESPEPTLSEQETSPEPPKLQPATDSKGSGLAVTSGIPGNQAKAHQGVDGLTEQQTRRDVPMGSFGEDPYGNPYVPASAMGCGFPRYDGGCGGNDYATPFEEVRFYSNDWIFHDKTFRFGQFFLDGSVSAGGTNQNQWPITNALGSGGEGEMNDKSSDFGMNQFYLSFGREVARCGAWDIGAQADLLYGTDYLWASSIGLESRTTGRDGAHASRIANAEARWNVNEEGGYKQYGLAMPQAYAEIYAPLFSGFDMKLGHFYAPMGHESVQSTKNFFYTHSYSFNYGQPHTFTGLLGDLKLGGLSVQGGFSQGWDTWDDNKGSLDLLAGLAFQFSPLSSLSFFMTSGDAIVDNVFDSQTNDLLRYVTGKQTSYSMVYQRKISDLWSWALEHDFGSADDAAATLDADGNVHFESGNWYSVVNYLYYHIRPNMTLGFRAEWFRDQNYTRVIGDYAVNEMADYKWDGDNFYDFSLGLNWQVCDRVCLRPEVRYDFSDAKATSLDGERDILDGVYDNFTDNKMWTFGADILVDF